MFIFFSLPVFSYQDTTRVKKDSLEKTVQFMPYFSKQKIKSLGNYIGVVDDSITFRLSSGISVLNTVRGKIPNTGISPYAPFATVRQNSALVIDGLLYKQSSANFYNMNAFDYSNLTVLNRGNAASWYGIDGGGGAFLLQSKSGENQTKPTVEFNSSLTSGYTKMDGSSTSSQSYISNAVAYMQDFGKIDTRISYNYLIVPRRNNKGHNIKINTGFNLNSKFNARLIIDNLYSKSSSSYRSSSSVITDSIYNEIDSVVYYVYDSVIINEGSSHSDHRFAQGNLMLRYQPLQWLTFTSQGSLGRVSESTLTINNLEQNFNDSEQNRYLINAFAAIQPNLGPSISLSSTFGFQYLSSLFESVSTSGYYSSSYHDKYYVSSINFGVHDFLFTNYTFRKDLHSKVPYAVEKPTHSFSVAFGFSEAFGLYSPVFSSGKIRASIGRTFSEQVMNGTTYRRPENLIEVGTDLFFAENRTSVTLNYFSGKRSREGQAYLPSTGYWDNFTMDGVKLNGFEVILNATLLKTSDYEYYTTLLWTKSQGNLEEYNYASGVYGYDYRIPRWTSSILNSMTFKNFLLRCLIVMRADKNSQQFGAVDNTQIKMRDISIGYDLSKIASKIGFREAHISLTMRNSWLIYSSSGVDAENYFIPEPLSGSSLNLYFVF
jgi:hypothetical protein